MPAQQPTQCACHTVSNSWFGEFQTHQGQWSEMVSFRPSFPLGSTGVSNTRQPAHSVGSHEHSHQMGSQLPQAINDLLVVFVDDHASDRCPVNGSQEDARVLCVNGGLDT